MTYEDHLTPDIALPIIDRRVQSVVAEAYDNQVVMQTHVALGNSHEAAAFSERIENCNTALTALLAERSRWEQPADANDG